jgi:hypothetical protein
MKDVICNYAVVRFMPYRRTAEFVNVGIVVCCPKKGFFDFKCADDHWRRVHGFFPELERDIFAKSLRSTINELQALKLEMNAGEGVSADMEEEASATWKELLKPREGIVHLAMPGIDRSQTPEQSLADLYDDFVSRHFAHAKEYQELVMHRRLAKHLSRWKVRHLYHERRVGSDIFHVNMPFVHEVDQMVLSAIKPLDLDRSDSTDIFHHGDRWLSNLKRLAQVERSPRQMIFPVSMPSAPAQLTAAQQVVRELKDLHALTVPFDQIDRIRQEIHVAA